LRPAKTKSQKCNWEDYQLKNRSSEHFKKYATLTANMVAKRVTRPMGAIGTNTKPH
jgi:hypothetical protein